MASGKVILYRLLGIIFASMVTIVLIVILALQWRKVAIVGFCNKTKYGLLYNTAKKSVETDTMYYPGRYYVGAGSYFYEFPSTQQSILFVPAAKEAKQQFAIGGAFIAPEVTALSAYK